MLSGDRRGTVAQALLLSGVAYGVVRRATFHYQTNSEEGMMNQIATQTVFAPQVVKADVQTATKAFAAALAATPEFQAYEEALFAFRQDHMAQEAVRAFQEKQRSLQVMQQLGALSQAELDELTRLQHDMVGHTTVEAYIKAQNDLVGLCRTIGKELSQAIGLDFVSACRGGCCG